MIFNIQHSHRGQCQYLDNLVFHPVLSHLCHGCHRSVPHSVWVCPPSSVPHLAHTLSWVPTAQLWQYLPGRDLVIRLGGSYVTLVPNESSESTLGVPFSLREIKVAASADIWDDWSKGGNLKIKTKLILLPSPILFRKYLIHFDSKLQSCYFARFLSWYWKCFWSVEGILTMSAPSFRS